MAQHFWTYENNEWVLTDEDRTEEIKLVVVSTEKLPMKDFGQEARAMVDLTGEFLTNAVILLDLKESNVDKIVDCLLTKIFPRSPTAGEVNPLLGDMKTNIFADKSMQLLGRTIQTVHSGQFIHFDDSWICCVCDLACLSKRHLGIVRLQNPTNFGPTCQKVQFFIVVLCPIREKGTKKSLETGRTLATMFCDPTLRQRLLAAETSQQFKDYMHVHAVNLANLQSTNFKGAPLSVAVGHDLHNYDSGVEQISNQLQSPAGDKKLAKNGTRWTPFQGIRGDIQRRMKHYWGDYRDGIFGDKSWQKSLSTTCFLYFACLLPPIAFGALNDQTTHGVIDVKKTIVGQTIGGLVFVLLSGQPLNILLTTAPLCLYVKIIQALADTFQTDFGALYCSVGLWCSLFILIFAIFDVSKLMKWSTRSTEEIFALFISISFLIYALKDTMHDFEKNYNSPSCLHQREGTNQSDWLNYTPSHVQDHHSSGISYVNSDPEVFTNPMDDNDPRASQNFTKLNLKPEFNGATVTLAASTNCSRDSSILFLFLMLGTLWLGWTLYSFNKTPYLPAGARETLSEYALPLAVILFSFIGSFLFQDVNLSHFKYNGEKQVFQLAGLEKLTLESFIWSIGLGFCLAVLMFMDQNIGAAIVNSPSNRLKKGPAYHWDLVVMALINIFMSIFTLPWMHSAIPHSQLHVRSLADLEQTIDQGHVYERIVRVRETRVPSLAAHILIGLSLLLLPYPLGFIPNAVLDGLFLYMGITALAGNQLFERFLLFFVEQGKYPPSHSVRRVPQRKIHTFTCIQLLELLVMCIIGFFPLPYVKMVFPLTLLLLLLIRHQVLPHLIEKKYLHSLDGQEGD